MKEISNEEIVKAAKESKEKYQEWLKGGVKAGGVGDWPMCVLFNHCNKCVFPTCGEDGTSYKLLVKHWKSDHKKYHGGEVYPVCVSKCCEPYGEAVIKDLNDIIEKYSEPEKTYKYADIFKYGNFELMLCQIGLNKICLIVVSEWDKGNRWRGHIDVSDSKAITHSELTKIFRGFTNFTHISGPTFKPENLCPCGFEFGKDYNVCGDPHSLCNKNPMICEYKDGYKETLWYKCREQSKKDGK